jgi:crotonobetaine/carnitine-CoA ligase
MSSSESVFLPGLLQRQAADRPTGICVTFEDGETWTWKRSLQECWRAGNALRGQGIRRGDRVVIMLENGPEWLRTWWGLCAIGATMVPVNPALRGELLRHCCTITDPVAAVAVDPGAQRIRDMGLGLAMIDPRTLATGDDEQPALASPLGPWDIHTINFTSGTTGLSKAVITPYLTSYMAAASGPWDPGPDDVLLAHSPLFHSSGQVNSLQAWLGGAAIAMRAKFTRSRFLEVVRAGQVTMVNFVGTMAAVIESLPERADDADNPIRIAKMGGPMVRDPGRFMERFGIDELCGAFGMTEIGTALAWRAKRAEKPGCVGRPRPTMEARLVDEHDVAVPPGQMGELIVRCARPWEITPGYYNDPVATAQAWRNGWFHTGDAFVADSDGDYFFVDRYKDSLRRRGENISSFEIEREVNAHPAVAESACVGVPAEFGEEDVKVFVVPVPGGSFDPADLVRFLEDRMIPFMVPRYVEVVGELPKTASLRVMKAELRQRGNSPRTWDRER